MRSVLTLRNPKPWQKNPNTDCMKALNNYEETKHPAIFQKESHISRPVCQHIHEKVGH